MIKIIKGDLIELAKEGRFDMIIHGCNCFKLMKSGIARQIAQEFPGAIRADNESGPQGHMGRLGDYSMTRVPIGTSGEFFLINLYTQFQPGKDFLMAALDLGLYKLFNNWIDIDKIKVGVPWIGCGIGGGDKQEVIKIFNKYSLQVDLTIVEL